MMSKVLSLLILFIGLPTFLLSGEEVHKQNLQEELVLCRQCNLTRLNYINYAVLQRVDSIQ